MCSFRRHSYIRVGSRRCVLCAAIKRLNYSFSIRRSNVSIPPENSIAPFMVGNYTDDTSACHTYLDCILMLKYNIYLGR